MWSSDASNPNDETRDEELIEVSRQLAEIERESGWTRTVAIGSLIIEKFFSGQPSSWHSRRATGHQSLRRLASRPECPLKKSALAEAVGVYVVLQNDPKLVESPAITPSHVARVLRLEEAARRRLLRNVEEEGLSVRALAERVRSITESVQHAPIWKTRRSALRRGLEEALATVRNVRLASSESLPDDARQVYAIWELLESLELELMEAKGALCRALELRNGTASAGSELAAAS